MCDSDTAQFTISALGPNSVITATSFGYGGGLDALGNTILPGGFATSLSLYDAATLSLQAQDTLGGTFNGVGCSNGATPDAGYCLDASFTHAVAPGDYILVLTQQLNDGLDPMGFPYPVGTNFTGGPFIDLAGRQRNGNYTLQINVTDGAVVTPDPATDTLVMLGIGALGFLKRIRRRMPSCPTTHPRFSKDVLCPHRQAIFSRLANPPEIAA